MIKYLYTLNLLFIILIGCTKEQSENKSSGMETASNVFTLKTVTSNDKYPPDFEWIDKSGNSSNFKSFHNKLTIINFWATWCAPCKKELPDLIAISNEFASKGVKVIGISTDRGHNVFSDVSEFIKKNRVTYPIIIDNGQLAEAFGNVRGLPTTFYIDEKGKVVETFIGLRTKEFFVEKINHLLH